MEKINEYLTEAMGECWHEFGIVSTAGGSRCKKCGKYWPLLPTKNTLRTLNTNNFFTWEGFGKLWEWAQEQEWWDTFSDPVYGFGYPEKMAIGYDVDQFINPERFATAVYYYLRGVQAGLDT